MRRKLREKARETSGFTSLVSRLQSNYCFDYKCCLMMSPGAAVLVLTSTLTMPKWAVSLHSWAFCMLSLRRKESGCKHSPADSSSVDQNTVPECWICECHLKHWLAQPRTGKRNGYEAGQQRSMIERERKSEENKEALQQKSRRQFWPTEVTVHGEKKVLAKGVAIWNCFFLVEKLKMQRIKNK